MINFVKIGVLGCLFYLSSDTFAQAPVDCKFICAPITAKIIKGNSSNGGLITLPVPALSLQNGQYPFNTVITFQTPAGLVAGTGNTASFITEYKWDWENTWTTGNQAILKNSGELSVRTRAGANTSDIQKATYQIYYNQVLLVGNSITQHGPFADIQWTGDWGMAASAADKDYKSTLERFLQATHPTTKTRIFPTARIENDFLNYDFEQAQKDFGEAFAQSDLIVIRLGENNKDGEIPGSQYKTIMQNYINMIKQHPNARVVITSVFWEGFPNTNAVLKQLADENGYDWVSLIEIGQDSSNYAYGLFPNPGVAKHPNDKGMKAIADLIYAKIK